jgi:hypothetical protein
VEGPRDEERQERRGDERQRLVASEAVVGGRPEAQRQKLTPRKSMPLYAMPRNPSFDRGGVMKWRCVREEDREREMENRRRALRP